MNATILKFPIERTAGYSANVPSLAEMYLTLASNYAVLDDMELKLFVLIEHNMVFPEKAKVYSLIEYRSIAWTMICRHGLNQERG